eukprot:11558564-Alexandrium_andersonii.AAC.1
MCIRDRGERARTATSACSRTPTLTRSATTALPRTTRPRPPRWTYLPRGRRRSGSNSLGAACTS